MSAAQRAIRGAAIALAASLAACSSNKRLPGDNEPTLATLRDRVVAIAPDKPENALVVAEAQTIAAYRQFLQSAPNAPQRPEAMRRIGDLEMDNADRRSADAGGDLPDYKAAIARYQEFLKAYPSDPRNDRVLYQLARAQEQGGDLEQALKTLTLLVAQHPGTIHADEAHFRRGEMLFALRDYKEAEAAYATVLEGARSAQTRTPFTERALYMQGWSTFKQGRLDDGLAAFFGVLDIKLGSLGPSVRDEAKLEDLRALTRADRELVDDTFRVMSISLAGLQGAESVARYITMPMREAYQFRVYGALGELYSRQERIKDAADTYALFVRRQPLHVQAPLLQARVIELYEKNGFDTLALQAKKEHVLRYGVDSEFRRANPGGWQRVQPLVQTHLTQLAQHHHALAQRGRVAGGVQAADEDGDGVELNLPRCRRTRPHQPGGSRQRCGVDRVQPHRVGGLEQQHEERGQVARVRRAGQQAGLQPRHQFACERQACAEAEVGVKRRRVDVAPEGLGQAAHPVAKIVLTLQLVDQVAQPHNRQRRAVIEVLGPVFGRQRRTRRVSQPLHQPHQPQVALGLTSLRVGGVGKGREVPGGAHQRLSAAVAAADASRRLARWPALSAAHPDRPVQIPPPLLQRGRRSRSCKRRCLASAPSVCRCAPSWSIRSGRPV